MGLVTGLPIALALTAEADVRAQADAPAHLSMEEAVSIAIQRNRDVLASRLDVQASEVDAIAARLYPNPSLSYTLGNLVLGGGNPQPPMRVTPGAFDQPVQTIALSQTIDLWQKRALRLQAAERGIDQSRLLLEDAIREVAFAVRSAFADVLREQTEVDLAAQTRAQYAETVRLSQRRFDAGEISEAELRKIELEGLKYANAEVDQRLQLHEARLHLAALLALMSDAALPPALDEPEPSRKALSEEDLVARALAERPDLLAAEQGRRRAEAALGRERREALPDPNLGVAYTHSDFEVSGDNPNALAVTLALPLPLFDRNQAGIAHAGVDARRADNAAARLAIEARRQVAEAVARSDRARALLDVFEGGMLQRAESALKAARSSYSAGAVSLLELLEAQRTYIETHAQYLATLYDFRQASIDVAHAVGGRVP